MARWPPSPSSTDCPPIPSWNRSKSSAERGRSPSCGDLPGARQVLPDAAELARRTGYRSTEALLLHEIVRLGDPAAVADRLATLATECEGTLVDAYAAHAAASVRGRPAALVDVVDRFESLGALLLAAEVATEAAQAFQDVGDRRASAAQSVRAAGLGGQCEGGTDARPDVRR